MTIRLMHMSDTHHSAQNAKHTLPVLKEAIDTAIAENCRLAIHSGDLWDHVVLNSESSSMVSVLDEFRRLAEHMPVLALVGNSPHDVPGSLDVLSRLETTFPIHVSSTFETLFLSGLGQWCEHPSTDSECVLQVHCVPYPTVKMLCPDESDGNPLQRSKTTLHHILHHFGAEPRNQLMPTVLVAHLCVDNVETEAGTFCEPLGVSLERILAVGADYTALGHIHKAQQPMMEHHPVRYAGSMFHKTFGEPEEKGFWIVDIENKGHATMTWHKLQSTVPLCLIEWREGQDPPAMQHTTGKRTRIRFHVAHLTDEIRAQGDTIATTLIANGALDVKVEYIVEPAVTLRSETVSIATTLVDKYKAYCEVTNREVTDRSVQLVKALESCKDPTELVKL